MPLPATTAGVADATPFTFTSGYTIAFDELHTVGLTMPKHAAESFAHEAARFAALPDRSVQNPILTFAPHDIVALATRLRPFMGQLGTSPSTVIPDSHNAGDFGSFLIGAPHRYALSPQELERHKTDGHMDIDAVRAGAILICPAAELLDLSVPEIKNRATISGAIEIGRPFRAPLHRLDARGLLGYATEQYSAYH